MNSETQYLVKLMIIDTACESLLVNEYIKEAHPTILWMREEIENVQVALMQGQTQRRIKSWLRVGDRVLAQIYTLRDDLPEPPQEPEPWSDLYLASVATHLLDDMAQVPDKGYLVEPLLTAAYRVEEMTHIRGMNEDQVRESAGYFIDQIYLKMREAA